MIKYNYSAKLQIFINKIGIIMIFLVTLHLIS